MFIGTFEYNMDSKNRVVIPAKFREELGEDFYVSKGINGCLFVQSKENWETFVGKLNSLPMSKATKLTRFFCSGADQPVPNTQGRIILPDHLRKYAEIEKEVTLIGNADRVEIWSTAKWQQEMSAHEDDEVFNVLEESGI